MTANVNIIVDQRDNVLTVPNRAIRTRGRQKMVTVLFEGQQLQTPVVTGLSSDTATEIISGLKEGDVVVVTTHHCHEPRSAPAVAGRVGRPGQADSEADSSTPHGTGPIQARIRRGRSHDRD